jgi:hypothetical protein
MQSNRVARREWSVGVGPRGYHVRVFQNPAYNAGNISLEIRDWRQPTQYRYRALSLRHKDRERAVRYARVLSRWWKRTGTPPAMIWRRGRGLLPPNAMVP